MDYPDEFEINHCCRLLIIWTEFKNILIIGFLSKLNRILRNKYKKKRSNYLIKSNCKYFSR